MNLHQRAKLEKLLRPGERLDASEFPWPFPKEGDLVRALCLFDRDPLETQEGYFIEEAALNCRVWNVEESASNGIDRVVYYKDVENAPLPRNRLSKRAGEQTWGGVEFWSPNCSGLTDVIPMSAIKPSLLGEYAKKLKRRAEGIENGLFP